MGARPRERGRLSSLPFRAFLLLLRVVIGKWSYDCNLLVGLNPIQPNLIQFNGLDGAWIGAESRFGLANGA